MNIENNGGIGKWGGDIEFCTGPNTEYPYVLISYNTAVYALFKTFQDILHRIHGIDLCFVGIRYKDETNILSSIKLEPLGYSLSAYEDNYVCMILDHILYCTSFKTVYLSCTYNEDGGISVFVLNDPKCVPSFAGQPLYYEAPDRQICFANLLFAPQNKKHIVWWLVDEAYTWIYMNTIHKQSEYNATNKDVDKLINQMPTLTLEDKCVPKGELYELEHNELRLDKEF
jgi:hypothetical protein